MDKENLKHASNIELLNEVQGRCNIQIITRQELLKLAGINWCLECQNNREVKSNGYCGNCNDSEVRIVRS